MAPSTKKDALRASNALESASGKSVKKASKTDYTKGHEEIVDRVIRRKFVADNAKTIYAQSEAEIIAAAEKIHEEQASQGNFAKSINLAGKEFEGLNVAFADSFSAMPPESKKSIIASYVASGMSEEEATAAFEKNFYEKRTVAMEDTSNETIAALDLLLKFGQILVNDEVDIEDSITKNDLEKLRRDLRGRVQRGGQIEFGKIFNSKIELLPTSGMDKNQYEQPEAVRGFLKQRKASTKVKVQVATKAAADMALKEVSEVIRETTKE
jgi:hypothetical protein